MNIHNQNKPARSWHKSRGFSLVELMVALVITLILLAGIGQIYLSSKKSFVIQNSLGRMQENGRYAMETIIADIRRAGYWGGNVNISEIGGLGLADNDLCNTGDTAWVRRLERRIYGLSSNAGYDCIPDTGTTNGYERGDILVARYAAPWSIGGLTTPTFDNDRIYLRTRLFAGLIFAGVNEGTSTLPLPPPVIEALNDGACNEGFIVVKDDDGTPIECSRAVGNFVRTSELVAHAYYIGNSGQQCRGTDVPSLFRVSARNGGTPTTIEEIAYGVDQLQVQYGLDTDGDLKLDKYVNAGDLELDESSEWNRVIAARIWLLTRAECAETGYTNSNPYEMGELRDATAYIPNDGFRRQLYTSTVQLRNSDLN